jgi:LPS-assembly protein
MGYYPILRWIRGQGRRGDGLCFLPALLLFLFLPSSGFSQSSPLMKYEYTREPIRVRADSITYEDSSKTYLAEGKVEIWQGDRKLTADRVVLNSETQEAEATGDVLLVQGEDFLRSKRMKIGLDTNLGIVIQGTLFLKKQNYYLRGEEIERVGENTYRIRGGTFTTCNGDWPAWRFTGDEALITLEEYADIWGATFQIKNIPLLYFPYLVLPVKTQRQSGFLFPRVGYSNTAGAFLDLPYYWAIAPNMDATFFLDTFTKKGIGEGLEYRYIRNRESAGSLNAYHIREWAGYRKLYTDPLDRGPDRWQVDFSHDEYITPTFFSKARLRAFSDREYFKDYGATYADQSSVEAYSIVSLTKNWERYSLFGEGRHTVDLVQEQPATLQYYPITHFLGLQQALGKTPLFFNFDTSYGYFFREQGSTGNRIDLLPRVSLPLRWKWLEFNTELNGRETWYVGIDNGENHSWSRQLWSFQTSLATDFYRIFDSDSSRVPKWKHMIRPEIGYLYIPYVQQTQIPYYDLPVPQTNAFFYGFSSRLIGKIVEGSATRYEEYGYLKISQQYNLQETTQSPNNINDLVNSVTLPLVPPGESRRGFGLINGELRLRGLKYVTLENITTYDPNQNQVQTNYTTLGLTDLRGDGLYLEYNWVKGVQEQLNGNLRVRILPSLDFTFARRLSLSAHEILDTSYGILYRHQCWNLQTTYTETPSVSGAPAQRKIMFLFTLYGVTSVGSR